MQGPLQVAIAGRVKAGKSTLLNALVGERLAPTDAGECTRIVSWYRKGTGYQVSARLLDGRDQALAFKRNEGALDIELGSLTERDVRWIDVRWPASTLDTVTLIDTPGIASLNDENSRRTREFLEPEQGASGDADAVIYLMRHVHAADVAFLEAFMDRTVAAASASERGRRVVAGGRDRRRPARRARFGEAHRRPVRERPADPGAVRVGHPARRTARRDGTDDARGRGGEPADAGRDRSGGSGTDADRRPTSSAM